MYKKVKNIFFVLIISFFFVFVGKYYFSEKNILFINKSRSSYLLSSNDDNLNLPTLKSDTHNVIIYIDGKQKYKKERKKRFWEKLISNQND